MEVLVHRINTYTILSPQMSQLLQILYVPFVAKILSLKGVKLQFNSESYSVQIQVPRLNSRKFVHVQALLACDQKHISPCRIPSTLLRNNRMDSEIP